MNFVIAEDGIKIIPETGQDRAYIRDTLGVINGVCAVVNTEMVGRTSHIANLLVTKSSNTISITTRETEHGSVVDVVSESPSSDKEYQESIRRLRKERDEFKNKLDMVLDALGGD